MGFRHAYVDPGTGSLIIQAVVGGVAAGAVALKMYGRRMGEKLRLRRRR